MCDTPLRNRITRLAPKSRIAFFAPGTSLARPDTFADSPLLVEAEMPEIPREAVLQAVLPILSEAFAGLADPRSTQFVNNAPDCGLFGTLDARAPRQSARHALGRVEVAAG